VWRRTTAKPKFGSSRKAVSKLYSPDGFLIGFLDFTKRLPLKEGSIHQGDLTFSEYVFII
jgi:hypothetical protein